MRKRADAERNCRSFAPRQHNRPAARATPSRTDRRLRRSAADERQKRDESQVVCIVAEAAAFGRVRFGSQIDKTTGNVRAISRSA